MNISRNKKLVTILRDSRAALRSAQVSVVLLTVIALLPLSAMAQNPVPLVYQPTAPTSAAPGSSTFTLTVTGTGFVSGSTINWNGSPQTTSYVSGEKLTASIPASAVTKGLTATVTVTSPTPGGGKSNPVYFTVSASYSTISMLRNDVTAGNPDGIVAGDFIGNGILDLAVSNNPAANGAGNGVAIYIGNGDGTFQAPVTYAVGHPGALTVGDFNGDGKLDIAVLQPLVGQVAILLGNGDGTFGPSNAFGTGSDPVAIATADVNGDGHLDLVIANFKGNNVSVLLGNGDGTFQTQQTYNTGINPTAVAIGDFNGDGFLDLAVANNNDNTVSIMLNNGTGGFPTQTPLPTASVPTGVVSADFNGDGILDLAVSTASRDASVLLGNGDGTFKTHVEYPTGVNSQAIATADMNSDGFLDLVVANFTDNTVSILRGNGNGTFKPQFVYPTNTGPDFLAIGDFNNDGKLDVAAVDATADMVSILTQSSISVTPNVVAFSYEEMGIASAPSNVVLKNGTASAYSVSTVTIGGTNATDFSQTNTCVGSLAANASCTIAVIFNPQPIGTMWWLQPQNRSAELLINGSNGSTGAGLTGDGQVNITLGPTRDYTFPKIQLVNTTSAAKEFTLTNSSGVPITLTGVYYSEPSGIVITGTNAGDFHQTNNCPESPATLAAGVTCFITATFQPTIASSLETATLNVFGTFSQGAGQQAVELRGMSTAVSVKPTSLTFPATTVGTSSKPMAVVLTNAGSSALPILSTTIQGDSKDFQITSNTCGLSVGPGVSCKIGITFTPQATGTLTGTLNIGDSDPFSPQVVTLTGTGQ
jgi:hypothetical protein